MPIPIAQHIRLAELRKKLEGKLQLLDLLKEIMQSKTPP